MSTHTNGDPSDSVAMENNLFESPPTPKKPRMSTTDTDPDTPTSATAPGEHKPRRYKRRKVAIFFAYCGVGYQGMQKNPGAKTIEGDLEEALYHSGAVPESDRAQPKRYDWARSARTDKGVSAVGQVVSGRFYVDPPGFVDRLNANLPTQIRIFGYNRVTATFNAKKLCDRRRYVYLLPVFALDASCHRDRESVMASVGSENELVKCLECSERGRKVVGLMGNKRNLENKIGSEGVVDSDISSNTLDALGSEENNLISCMNSDGNVLQGDASIVKCQSDVSSNHGNTNLDIECKEPSNVSLDIDRQTNLESDLNSEPAMGGERSGGETNGCGNEETKVAKGSEFRYGEEEKERFNRILKYYEGTHNFHNFTTRTKAEDPSAKRYIVSFEANTTLKIEGMEFVKCEVVGQSFMLHQIRKMIGLAVAIMRNFAPESIFESAFQQDVHINVPTAPEVGLYLDECLFTSYNNRWKDSHEELSMKAYAEEAEEFKMKHIYSHIANTEHKEGTVGLWLHSLNHRNYPDLRASGGGAVPVSTSTEGDALAK